MTKVVVFLAVMQVCILMAIGAFILGYDPEPAQLVAEVPALVPEEPEIVEVIDDPDAGLPPEPREVVWLPLERLEFMEGPWRTADGELLVSVANRGELVPTEGAAGAEPYEATGWRLVVEWDHGPVLTCGLYLAIQYSAPPLIRTPWRLGYCRGRNIDPQGPAVATRVALLRTPGADYLRLVLGTEIDVLLYQVQ